MVELLYEDPWVDVVVPMDAAAQGHLQVRSKLEVTTLDALTDAQIEHLYFVASYAGTAIFELIGAQGTNMILTENDSSLCIDIIARTENDGLNVLWSPTEPGQAQIERDAKAIKDAVDIIVWHEQQGDKPSPVNNESSSPIQSSENYLIKHLHRHP